MGVVMCGVVGFADGEGSIWGDAGVVNLGGVACMARIAESLWCVGRMTSTGCRSPGLRAKPALGMHSGSHCFGGSQEVVFTVFAADRNSQSWGICRDGGIADGWDQQSLFE